MRIYLDNCCFNRPFDDQREIRVRIEAEAKLFVQDLIRVGSLELVWSYILDFENVANPFEERRTTIGAWRQLATDDIGETPEIVQQAGFFAELGLRPKDALHLACALAGGCEYFLTTDDGILKRGKNALGVVVTDPATFVREWTP